jgi:hypothetical protein
MSDDEIEAVASAFYAVEYNSRSWERAPEPLKEMFRMNARVAIAACQDGYLESDLFEIDWMGRGPEAKKYLH